ncbi:unnamed protein product [Trichobilharzia szidati]|nr:unnamed protein product [Trichobilharzia szidati]
MVNRFHRINPFDGSVQENQSAISALYDAQTGIKNVEKGFSESMSNDYFSVPFVSLLFLKNPILTNIHSVQIHINETSTVEDLEDAILKCKHMFLALSKESSEKKERLLDRLIELRRILQDVKEFSGMSTNSSRHSLGCTPAGVLNTSSISRNLSQVSLPSLSYQTISPEGSRSSLRHTSYPGGHDFQMVSAIRHLGRTCECCGRIVRRPTGKIFSCRTCHIICHFDGCLNSLVRRCPGAPHLSSTVSGCYLGFRRLRTESESGAHKTSGLSPTVNFPDLRHRISFKYLDVSNLSFISANLTSQSWTCAECSKPINFSPSDAVLPRRLNKSNCAKAINEVLERGIGALVGKAFEDLLPKSDNVDQMTPQISSQQPSLSAYLMKFVSPELFMADSNQLNDPLKHYAISASNVTFEPIQTWYDACVMQAFKKVSRPIPSSLLIDIQNGHLKFDKPSSVSNLLENSSSDSPYTLDSAHLCYYSGYFYCSKCHWGDTFQIPACMFVMGDYKAKPVCRTSYLWLNYAWSRHLFRVPLSWYYHEPLARQVCSLRSRIFRLQPYFNVCSDAKRYASDIEEYGLEWFLEQPFTFTMDLVSQVLNGKLIMKLKNLLSKVDEHIGECQICKTYVPSYCTVCNEGPVRPHDLKMTFCNRCNKSCHR